ncbi:hypothetical protein SAMN06295912_102216 [Sphingomonas laterariae]|uniref:Uncharacterized protein n=1 Tax=Edaphosphingomonas laterariae TaxID=861865 RepID=A0A239CJG6_9SPHN|nr:hypothetical protein [Sphingomonas laterariae]SNS19614.1 hypothetical protein SAMN06295912_102216 [Sphingomonas laterariae]
MARVGTYLLCIGALATGLAMAGPGEAKRSKSDTASAPAAAPYAGPVIKAYKRDPLPIFDDAGDVVREVTRGALPPIGTEGARVVRAKPGFVGIMLDGELAWLRMSMVDYVGDVKAIKCNATTIEYAKLEEEGLDQSLGLGCAK